MELEKIKIEVEQLPVVTSNLHLLKTQVDDYLKNFNFLVTEDGIKFAKEKASELKAMADALNKVRKEIIDEASKPLNLLDAQAKELINSLLKTRESITSQMEKLKQVELKKVEQLLQAELSASWELHGVLEEFQKATIADLVALGSITAGGKLTKKANDALGVRVLADKALQERISERLLTLEGRCLKAGLKAPLNRVNIEHFLFAPAETYEQKLLSLIETELGRQNELEERLQKQADAKAKLEIDAHKAKLEAESKRQREEAQNAILFALEQANNATPNVQITIPESPINNTIPQSGQAKYLITVQLELVARDMDIATMKSKAYDKFMAAGFKSIQDVRVAKHTQNALSNSVYADNRTVF